MKTGVIRVLYCSWIGNQSRIWKHEGEGHILSSITVILLNFGLKIKKKQWTNRYRIVLSWYSDEFTFLEEKLYGFRAESQKSLLTEICSTTTPLDEPRSNYRLRGKLIDLDLSPITLKEWNNGKTEEHTFQGSWHCQRPKNRMKNKMSWASR